MERLRKHINILQELKKNKVDADESIGRSRGGLSTKIHCAVDGLGNPVDFILTGGQVHDSQCAEALLDGKEADFVIADLDPADKPRDDGGKVN